MQEGLPVQGYRPQTDDAIALVNGFKRDEERLLRKLDELAKHTGAKPGNAGPSGDIDGRWLAIGRTHLEQAFMAINRSIFRPGRVRFPEDEDRT